MFKSNFKPGKLYEVPSLWANNPHIMMFLKERETISTHRGEKVDDVLVLSFLWINRIEEILINHPTHLIDFKEIR